VAVARLVGPDDRPVKGELGTSPAPGFDQDQGGAGEEAVAEVRCELSSSRSFVFAIPEDPSLRGVRREVVDVRLGDSVDLGEIRCTPRDGPLLTVRDAAGRPLAHPVVGVEGRYGLQHLDFLAEDGSYDPAVADVEIGDVVIVETGFSLTRRFALAGPPPWHLVCPRGALEVKASSPEGPVPRLAVVVDGQPFEAEGEVLEVSGLSGRHEVIVSASGHHAQRRFLDVPDGELYRLEVVLRPIE